MKIYRNVNMIPVSVPVMEMITHCIETKKAPNCLVAHFNAIKRATIINLEHKYLQGLDEIDIKEAVSEAIGLYIFKANKEHNDFVNEVYNQLNGEIKCTYQA
jgi:hypothetical protein